MGDIYITRRNPRHGWEEPINLGCNPSGPNTSAAEFSPSFVETDEGVLLYFSKYNVGRTQDIYVSRQRADGSFGPGEPVAELNLATHDDQMQNVSRDGLEIVFASIGRHTGSSMCTPPTVPARATPGRSAGEAWEAR